MEYQLVQRGSDYHVHVEHSCPHCSRITSLVGPIGSQASWYCPCGNALTATIPNVYLHDTNPAAPPSP